MKLLKKYRWWFVVLLVAVVISGWFVVNQNGETLITTTAETGTVTASITVSGVATVNDIIPLSFPSGGTVSGVFVERGSEVTAGMVLATVGDDVLQSEYVATLADVTRLQAERDILLNGQTSEESAVTAATVKNAEDALSNIIKTEAARVEIARQTLYSSGLSALAVNPNLRATPPVVSGSYTCTAEGTYRIEVYSSNSASGISYRYSGVETGTANASTNQPGPLGECGLLLKFDKDSSYTNAVFTISIPNTAHSSYTTNRALLDQALTQEEANISAARRALDLTQNQASVATAGTRVERLISATASITAAEARLARASALLSERAIRAPSAGVITSVDVVVGQTVSNTPALTLFTPRSTTITARLPEKDVARVTAGQSATVTFDADTATPLSGTVSFISPIATQIGGIPYYEAEITLTETPTWLRSGMQADVEIAITSLENTVRIPRLYLVEDTVLIKEGEVVTPVTPTVLLVGTDGFVAVDGISSGTTIVLP